MEHDVERIVRAAGAIRLERYPDAAAVFAAGSLIRGEGTACSDLDLVVVYSSLPSAYRQSFKHAVCPVEAFVHDPETLEYFFEQDRASGIPALPQMVFEGIDIPASSELSRVLKQRAAALITAGPPPLDAETEARWRYAITDLLDDLRDPRSDGESMAIGARLYEQLADYHLRRNGLWSARGKGIPRVLGRTDPALSARYTRCFEQLFAAHDARHVTQLAEDLLRSAGGPLFDGYRADAPPDWRRSRGA